MADPRIHVSSLPYDLSSFTLISKGAEAHVLQGEILGVPVILKSRVPKAYRLVSLDTRLRRQRTSLEAKIMHAVKAKGVPVPFILDVDVMRSSLLMTKIPGTKLRDVLYSHNIPQKRVASLFFETGKTVNRMHQAQVIHGDLTTSNIIVSENDVIYLIDFGLGKFSDSLEDRAVDLLVLKRTLESTHQDVFTRAWEQFQQGYSIGSDIPVESVFHRLSVIEQRARHMI